MQLFLLFLELWPDFIVCQKPCCTFGNIFTAKVPRERIDVTQKMTMNLA